MKAKVLQTLERLQREGIGLRMPVVAPLEGHEFWELRIEAGGNQSRIFYFAHTGRRMVLLHGYNKKTQRAPRRELATAERRMNEYLRRQA